MTHELNCPCSECDDMRFVMSIDLNKFEDCTRYARWLTARDAKRGLRTASAGELRCGTNVTYDNEQESIMSNDYSPIDPYAAPIAKIRAANATPMSTFEDSWRADRLREIDEQHAAFAAQPKPKPLRALTAAESAQYAPVDSYAAGLAALKKEIGR